MENFIKAITMKAGAAVLDKFGKIGVAYTKKNPNDVVTKADLLSNKILVDAIKKKYPTHGIISEEQGEHQTNAEYIWYVDPLDGSKNFSLGIPLFAVMAGVVRRGKTEQAVVFNPTANELYFARSGRGAYKNNKQIYCSSRKELAYSAGSVSTNVKRKLPFLRQLMETAADEHLWLHMLHSAAINSVYAAEGRVDWYINNGGGYAWDKIPTTLILSEAGCIVSNAKGQPWTLADRKLIASNKHLHKQLLRIFKDALN